MHVCIYLRSVCVCGVWTFLATISYFFVFSSTFYEDWAFILDEERASMLPTMAAGESMTRIPLVKHIHVSTIQRATLQ